MLTQDEVEHFRTFGFTVRRQIFSGEEMAGITSEFDDVLAEARGYEPFDGKQRQAVQPFVEKRKLLTNVVADDRIYLPLQQLLGEGFIWVGSDGNLYIGDTEWHGDRFQGEDGDHQPWDYAAIKVVFYFDPVRADSGCLRVIPGSQRQEFGDHLEFMWRLGAPRRPRPFGLAPEGGAERGARVRSGGSRLLQHGDGPRVVRRRGGPKDAGAVVHAGAPQA